MHENQLKCTLKINLQCTYYKINCNLVWKWITFKCIVYMYVGLLSNWAPTYRDVISFVTNFWLCMVLNGSLYPPNAYPDTGPPSLRSYLQELWLFLGLTKEQPLPMLKNIRFKAVPRSNIELVSPSIVAS